MESSKSKDIYKVKKDLQERIRNKYGLITKNVTEFDLGQNKIQIQSRIYEEFLSISEEEVKEVFKGLCIEFLKTCYKHQIQCKSLNILTLTDDELNRGLHVMVEDEHGGGLWGLIFIPPMDLKLVYGFWSYTFLHELGHCWLSVEYPKPESNNLTDYEIFVDLIAICTLREIIPPHKKLYRDVVKYRSYIGGKEGQQYFGKDIHKSVLQETESYLKTFIEKNHKKIRMHKI
jgi:hypothetical protein